MPRATRLAAHHPARPERMALGGVGEFYLRGNRIADDESRNTLADALLTPDKSHLTGRARLFRDFADQRRKYLLGQAEVKEAAP